MAATLTDKFVELLNILHKLGNGDAARRKLSQRGIEVVVEISGDVDDIAKSAVALEGAEA